MVELELEYLGEMNGGIEVWTDLLGSYAISHKVGSSDWYANWKANDEMKFLNFASHKDAMDALKRQWRKDNDRSETDSEQ
jgi:hypothetical protein